MRSGSREIRVMQSFRRPRPTTNPYIHMLDASLAETAGMQHLRFDRRRALFGRYDAIHFHWPEALLGGSTRTKAMVRKLYFEALSMRLRFSRIAVVRTVHNVDLPTDVTAWERRMLEWIERRTDHRILLNQQTHVARRTASTVIPHGDFRPWFGRLGVVPAEPTPNTLGFVGLVRRYKGVERLLTVFRETAEDAPELRLQISGNPSSVDLADEVRARAEGDPRIRLDLRFLDEIEFASAVMASEGVVLPYRFMHNSGTVLAALSLGRPVLTPRNEVNDALSREVGPGWIQMFDGELTPSDLTTFLPRARAQRTTDAPDLSLRTWENVGMAHREAYLRAVRARRGAR